MKNLQSCLVVCCCSLLLAITAIAQVQNGQFEGVVADPTGAAIVGAKITVVNTATNAVVTTTTNQSGFYVARELPVGSYKISAEAQGFKTKSDTNLVVNAGVVQRVDFRMEIGQTSTVVEVSGEATAVQVDDPKLSTTIGSAEIDNIVLNGRNVYDLMQTAPGAVSVMGTDFENGHGTVVNGVREDFNGFLINGVSNKGLSGGNVNTPIQDTVQEFQQLGLNMSAQYGNSAGTTVNLVTKSGSNQLHGSLWEYLRNDATNANDYFLNQQGASRPALRWNQFGFTLGGPIVKDKFFFFGSYQGSRFTTSNPSTITIESPEWRNAVLQADAATSVNSVAGLLYKGFQPTVGGGTLANTLDSYFTTVTNNDTGLGCVGPTVNANCVSGVANYADYLCPDTYGPLGFNLPGNQPAIIAARMQSILGVVPGVDNSTVLSYTGAPCSTVMAAQAGFMGRNSVTGVSTVPFQLASVSLARGQTVPFGINSNLFNGNEASLRLDFDPSAANRFSINYNHSRTTDKYGPCGNPACARGFYNPTTIRTPNGQFSFVHTFSPTVLNEFRAGYSQNVSPLTNVAAPGVPSVAFDDGSSGFGSYSGYPQFFKENVYTYSDMVSLTHGNHNIKIGADVRRNIENSEFNVARPSYYFTDPIFFAADAPYGEAAGVNPGICGPPCPQSTIQGLVSGGTVPNAQLETNIRHWRNIEFGGYFQDDWKATKRLTLQLGLRYDLYRRHNELNDKATTFLLGPGNNPIEGVINANVPAGLTGTIGGTNYDCTSPAAMALAQLAGVCGPGGFAAASSLGKGRHKDFGPRLGFAYDVFGNGKTALRGGFGISYEGTLYNPLSNSRWNLPYYSFNSIGGPFGFGPDSVVYGPANCTGSGTFPNNCVSTGGALFGPGGTAPTYLGAVNGQSTQGQGVLGAQATGNIDGWDPQNPNQALLTGIVFPRGIDDPYVYNYYFGVQHEIRPKTVIEFNYVGTAGHKLFRSEDVNRLPGAALPAGVTLTNNVGETLVGFGGRPNPNYGRLRVWENVVNSNYNALQASLKRQMSHGLLINVSYSYSHSIDNGSTWHSGATTANGNAGGEGFTTDPTHPQFDRGNSIYDIRHRLSISHVWQLPGQNMKGFMGEVVGGWLVSGVWAVQTGPHWEPFNGRRSRLTGDCSQFGVDNNLCVNKGGDYMLTTSTVGGIGRSNSRPDSSVPGFSAFDHNTWANGWCSGGSVLNGPCAGTYSQSGLPVLSAPCLGCLGNLGRNTFVGPGLFETDLTLAKNFKLTERFNLKFETAAFNVLNHTNFVLATAGGLAHNDIRSAIFGRAAGTVGPRIMQFGLKLSF